MVSSLLFLQLCGTAVDRVQRLLVALDAAADLSKSLVDQFPKFFEAIVSQLRQSPVHDALVVATSADAREAPLCVSLHTGCGVQHGWIGDAPGPEQDPNRSEEEDLIFEVQLKALVPQIAESLLFTSVGLLSDATVPRR